MMKYMVGILMALMLGTTAVWADSAPTSERDRLSYTVGYSTGKAMVAAGMDIATPMYERGLHDAMQHQKPALSDARMQLVMTQFQQKRMKEQQKTQAALAVKNTKEGQAFLKANAKRPGVQVLASGLQYKSLQVGHGAKPALTDSVTVDYEGRLLDGTVFDSSYKRNSPATLPLNAVIPGWQEALTLMSVGDTWELYVPASLAYGEHGAGPIGPNQVLVFKVHLRAIVTPSHIKI